MDNKHQVTITLERTPCFGRCPVYRVEMNESGNVVYTGIKYVAVEGIQRYTIEPEKVAQLVEEFNRIHYFSLMDRYDATVTDQPTVITSITIDGKTKRIENYYAAPEVLKQLEKKIDEAANVAWLVSRTQPS